MLTWASNSYNQSRKPGPRSNIDKFNAIAWNRRTMRQVQIPNWRYNRERILNVPFHHFAFFRNGRKIHFLWKFNNAAIKLKLTTTNTNKMERPSTLFHSRRASTKRWTWSFWREVRVSKWRCLVVLQVTINRLILVLIGKSTGVRFERAENCLIQVLKENETVLAIFPRSSTSPHQPVSPSGILTTRRPMRHQLGLSISAHFQPNMLIHQKPKTQLGANTPTRALNATKPDPTTLFCRLYFVNINLTSLN